MSDTPPEQPENENENQTAEKAKEVAGEAAEKAKEVAGEAAEKAKEAAGAALGALKGKMSAMKEKKAEKAAAGGSSSSADGHETDFDFSIPLVHTGKPGMAALAITGLTAVWFIIKGASGGLAFMFAFALLSNAAGHAFLFNLLGKMRVKFTSFKTSLVVVLFAWFAFAFFVTNFPGLFISGIDGGDDLSKAIDGIKDAAIVTFFKIHIFYFLCIVGGAMAVWRIQWQRALQAATGYGVFLLIYTVIGAKLIANVLGKFG